jgi:hypothetical protein
MAATVERITIQATQVTWTGSSGECFIVTGSENHPLLTLADNTMGAANIGLLPYARPGTHAGKKGVRLSLIQLTRPANLSAAAGAIAVNLFQEGKKDPPYEILRV